MTKMTIMINYYIELEMNFELRVPVPWPSVLFELHVTLVKNMKFLVLIVFEIYAQ